jgi:hypothetical protein
MATIKDLAKVAGDKETPQVNIPTVEPFTQPQFSRQGLSAASPDGRMYSPEPIRSPVAVFPEVHYAAPVPSRFSATQVDSPVAPTWPPVAKTEPSTPKFVPYANVDVPIPAFPVPPALSDHKPPQWPDITQPESTLHDFSTPDVGSGSHAVLGVLDSILSALTRSTLQAGTPPAAVQDHDPLRVIWSDIPDGPDDNYPQSSPSVNVSRKGGLRGAGGWGYGSGATKADFEEPGRRDLGSQMG